jgi:NADH dehydrogenase
MTLHAISARQLVPGNLDEVFAFFADPTNLRRLTPPSMGFEFLTADRELRSGLEIDYRIRPLFGIPVTWRTRITDVDPPTGFRDIQLAGPYRRWEHRHRFEPVESGTIVHDEVVYEVPLGPAGDLANALVVRPELRRIFGYRAAAVRSVFAPAGSPTGQTIAVVGGTGFVGGAIATELHRRGHRVVAVSSRGEDARGILPDAIEVRRADVRTGDGLAAALDGADGVVIALAFPNSPIEAPRRHRTFDEVDAGGTERVVSVARDLGVGRLVYLSGAGAAREAARHWFRAKWRAEESIRASGVDWTIIRPTWIFGPRDVSLNRFIGFARTLGFVPLTNTGRQVLAPVFVDDAAHLAADAIVDDRAIGQVFELGGPQRLTMRQIVETALAVADLHRPILPGPTPLIKLAAIPMSWLPSPLLTPDAVDFVNQPAVVDLAGLLQRMPRRLTPLAEGLRTYLGMRTEDASIAFDGSPEPDPIGLSAMAQDRSR